MGYQRLGGSNEGRGAIGDPRVGIQSPRGSSLFFSIAVIMIHNIDRVMVRNGVC